MKRKEIILIDENCLQNIHEKYYGSPKEETHQNNYYGKIGSLLSYANPFKFFFLKNFEIYRIHYLKNS